MGKKVQIILLTLTPILAALLIGRWVGEMPVTNLPLAMTFGFLAGLVLNIMPCVLPVVGIKVHSLIQQADRAPARIRALGLAFAAGILFVFMILGALAAFANLGWGQAFQSDTFLVTLIVFLTALALETFGVYTIQLPAFVSSAASTTGRNEGLTGSFVKGMLATVLATPCGAPLLGATLTYALRQPPPVTLIVFTAVGTGMALPYLMLTWNPDWLTLLPRSGPWSQAFREFTGFLLLATAVWLLWQRRFDGEFVVQTVAFCVLVSFAAWMHGRWSAPNASPARRLFAPLASVLLIGAGAGFCFYVMPDRTVTQSADFAEGPPTRKADPEPPQKAIQEWRPYRRDILDGYLAQGRTVMVMWTADW